MPRDGSGVYTRPAGTNAVPDTTIESAKYNTNVADVETDLNTPRPIVAGGTGGNSVTAALDNLGAEKFKQVVTNWDTAPWRAGSFYAATTASGTAPIANHAFAGIIYYANATDLVMEATDLTDVSDPTTIPSYMRIMTSGTWGQWIRLNNPTGAIGEYTFDGALTFPPASGQVRFNNSTQNSTTEIFISHTAATGADVTVSLPFTLRANSEIAIRDKDEPLKYKIFTLTADPVLSSNDFRATVTYKSGGTDLGGGQRMLLTSFGGGGSVRYDVVQTLLAAQQKQARDNIGVGARSFLAGLTLSTAGSSTAFGIAIGEAADSTNVGLLQLATAYTKTTGAWAVGTASGALDTGTITASTWYHVFLIKRVDTGVVDVLISLSATAPTLPASYTLFRRIGSLLTNASSQWVLFSQLGDEFLWSVPVGDVNDNTLGTTAKVYTLTVPLGVQVNALVRSTCYNASAGTIMLLHSLDEAVAAAGVPPGNRTSGNPIAGALAGSIATTNVRTNTSAQVRAVASLASSILQVATYGWIDRRGRDA
jgi:hypothetical protein